MDVDLTPDFRLVDPVQVNVPEPTTSAALLLGISTLLTHRRRREALREK